MKLLFVTHQYFPRHVGGTEVLVRQLATRTANAGHSPSVATYVESPSGDRRDYGVFRTSFDDLPLYEIASNLSASKHVARAEYDNSEVADSFRTVLSDVAPDVVHVAHAMKLSGAIFDVIRRSGTPVICSLSDYWFFCMRHTLLKPDGSSCSGPDRRYKCVACAGATHGIGLPLSQELRGPVLAGAAALSELAHRLQLPRGNRMRRLGADAKALTERWPFLRDRLLSCDRVIALSRSLGDLYISNGFPRDRLAVLRHGGDEVQMGKVRRIREARPPASLRLVFIGPLAEHKGAHVLVEAVRRASSFAGEVHFFGGPTGDGRYAERLKDLAAGDTRLRFCGTFPPEEMPRILERASALVHPAIWQENEPFVVKDALLAGVPVAVSDIGSLADLVEGVEGCVKLPPGDVRAWAKWLDELKGYPLPLTVEAPAIPTMGHFFAEMMSIYHDLAGRDGDRIPQ